MTSFPPPDGSSSSSDYPGPPSLQKPMAYGEPPLPPPGYGEQPPYGQPGYGPPSYGQPDHGQNVQAPYGHVPYSQALYGPPSFGQPGYPSPYGYPAAGPGQNGLGIAGMIVGIASLVLFWIPFLGGFLGLVGGVLSGIALPQAKSRRQSIGMPVAGLVCGILGFVVGVLWVVFYVWLATTDPYYY